MNRRSGPKSRKRLRQFATRERLALEPLETRQLLAADCGVEPVVADPLAASAVVADVAAAAAQPTEAIAEFTQVAFPSDTPAGFTTTVEFQGKTLTLEFTKNSVFGENTRFLIDDGSGMLKEVDPGTDRSYLGSVAGYPEYAVSAVLTDDGLVASILRPSQASITIEPSYGSGQASLHRVMIAEVPRVANHDHDGDGVPDHAAEDHPDTTGGGHPPGCACPACCGTTADVGALKPGQTTPGTPTASSDSGQEEDSHSTATLPPSRVIDVLEFEVGVEIGSNAFLNNYSGSTVEQKMASAMAVAQQLPSNLDARFLHAIGVKYRLGTVIMRTTAGSDPFNVTNGNDSSGLSAFRNYWNNLQANEGIAPTHDLAVYHVRASPSGLAYTQNTVGTSFRYALSASNGPTSWADGTIAHEFGHSWTLPHTGDGMDQGLFYEQRPRNNNGANSPGGIDFFISPMNGSGNHNIGRFATDEANRMFNLRDGKRQFAEVIAAPGPIKPFGHRDEAQTDGDPITIDVIANDYDANNDVLDVQLLDTVSFLGGTIALSEGTGPGGRNEIIYTPPSGVTGEDFFHYTVFDTDGRTDFGAVNVRLTLPVEIAYQFDFGIDENPAYSGNDAPAGLSPADSTWNLVTKNNATLAGVLDSEGNASNVGIRLREASDGAAFDFAAAAAGLEGRDANYSGFYGSDLMSNLMFTRDNDDLGMQVTGLPEGVYSVYAILREPIAPDRNYSVDIGAGVGDSPRFGDFGGGNATGATGAPDGWSQNQNFYRETVSVFGGESLFVLINSLDSQFVSLQGLQVTKVGDVEAPPAAAYQIDFGPTNDGVQSGVAGPAGLPSSFTSWNGYDNTTDELTNLLDAQGNPASGVTVRVREASDGQDFDFDAPVAGLENRDGAFSGFYAQDLLSGLIFSRDNDDLGVRIDGLAPGQYDVFAIAREPDSGAGAGSERTYSFDIGASTAGAVKFGELGLGHVTATPSEAPSVWVENQNYYAEIVTLAVGESLYVLMDSTNSEFGLLQGLQILQRAAAPDLIGDYNRDGTVDAADYTLWRDQEGDLVAAYSGADGDGDGSVGAADYLVWSGAYGQSSAPQASPLSQPPSSSSASNALATPAADDSSLRYPPMIQIIQQPSNRVRGNQPLSTRGQLTDADAVDQALLLVSSEPVRDDDRGTIEDKPASEREQRSPGHGNMTDEGLWAAF